MWNCSSRSNGGSINVTTAAAQQIEEFFSGGAKSAKFPDGAIGTVIGGEIVEEPRMQQQRDYDTDELVFYQDGNPAMQMVITVQAQPATDEDDGRRSFYVRGQLKQAVGEALRKVGTREPERGGKLWVKLTGEEPVQLRNGKPGKPKKIHAAKYEPAAQAAAGQFFADDQGASAEASTRAVADPLGGAPILSCPAGVDPGKWASMNPAQRAQMYDALGLAIQKANAAGSLFTEEPPF